MEGIGGYAKQKIGEEELAKRKGQVILKGKLQELYEHAKKMFDYARAQMGNEFSGLQFDEQWTDEDRKYASIESIALLGRCRSWLKQVNQRRIAGIPGYEVCIASARIGGALHSCIKELSAADCGTVPDYDKDFYPYNKGRLDIESVFAA